MAVDGIIAAVRTAVSAAVTAKGVTCRKYDSWTLSSGSLATLGAADIELAEGPDQSYGVRSVTLPVLIYQLVDGSAEKSMEYHEAAFSNVVDGLGADRTFGGKVAGSDITGDARQNYYREAGGRIVSIIEIPLRVMPFANAGS